MHRTISLGISVALTAVLAASALGASTPEQQCQKGRYAAAAKYGACEQKTVAIFFDGGSSAGFAKCRIKYAATWAKLQSKASGTGSSCDQARFAVSGGTVTDNLTGLQWEQKTDDASIHDKDNAYTWTAGSVAADGTAFTSFLLTLNGGGCFAGQCDWRLPTRAELQTVLSDPCSPSTCFDQAAFGPESGTTSQYWSATTYATDPSLAWIVDFSNGQVNTFVPKNFGRSARAVRGGL